MGTPTGRTQLVTDSTAMLPPEVAAERGIVVVPLQVVIGARVLDEGPDGATPDVVAEALDELLDTRNQMTRAVLGFRDE